MAYTVTEFRDWVDDEGGYKSLWRHGVDLSDVPEEIKEDWILLDAALRVVELLERKISAQIGY